MRPRRLSTTLACSSRATFTFWTCHSISCFRLLHPACFVSISLPACFLGYMLALRFLIMLLSGWTVPDSADVFHTRNMLLVTTQYMFALDFSQCFLCHLSTFSQPTDTKSMVVKLLGPLSVHLAFVSKVSRLVANVTHCSRNCTSRHALTISYKYGSHPRIRRCDRAFADRSDWGRRTRLS